MTSRCPEPTPARTDHRRQLRSCLAVIGAGGALVLGVPPTLAASPVNGTFTGTGKGACRSLQTFACQSGGAAYGAVEPFSLKVSGGKVVRLKFKFPLGAPDNDMCGFKSPLFPFQLDLKSISLPVSRSGKFKLRKRVTDPNDPANVTPHGQRINGDGPTQIRVDGKFTRAKKATGTFSITFEQGNVGSCDSEPYEWTATHK